MQDNIRIKRYIETYIPVSACNMNCTYCYLSADRYKAINRLKWTPEHIRKALSIDRLGGVCLINLCAAGETTMLPDFDQLIRQLAEEGHYISIVTNGTFMPFFERAKKIPDELWKHFFFKFSFHYYELEKNGTLELFWNNINYVKERGGSFTVELTPDDNYIPIKDKLYDMCVAHVGAPCHISIPRDDTKIEKPIYSKYNLDELSAIWSKFDSELFNFKKSIWGVKREEFCYAGDWSFLLDFNDGSMRACYESKEIIQNILDDVDCPICFEAVGKKCPSCHCYNGHAFLSLGVIPELNTPTYCELRNRDNRWLNDNIRQLFSSKLCDSNKEYSEFRKKCVALITVTRKLKRKISSLKRFF